MPGGPAPEVPARSRPVWLIVLVGLLVIALLGAVAFAGWAVMRRVEPVPTVVTAGAPRYATDALAAAESGAVLVFSYDYRSFDNDVKRGLRVCTGGFAEEYRTSVEKLRATVKNERAIVRAKVSDAGVVKVGPRRVEVLLFINQYRRNASIDGEKVDENRLVLVMAPGPKGTWLIAEVSAL